MPTLTDILRQHKVPFRQHGEDHHVTGGWIGCVCPWCQGGGYHFGFHLGTGAASCWKCGTRSTTAAIAKLCRISYTEAARLLGRKAAVKPHDTPVGTFRLPPGVSVLGAPHRAYVASRGLDPDEVTRIWGVKAIGMESRLSWRLFIPIRNPAGRTVSWTTRSIGSGQPRYLSAASVEEEEHHKHLLYGAELARLSIVIVEGPLDAWAIGPGAVATCGVSYSQRQLAAMSKYPFRAVCFDSSTDAQIRADGLCQRLDQFPGTTTRIELETGSDPADADEAEISLLRQRYLEA